MNDESHVTVFVSLAIYGDDLDLDSITEGLGLNPKSKLKKGLYLSPKGKDIHYKRDVWGYESTLEPEASLEMHLESILSLIRSKKKFIQSLSQSADIQFRCDIFGAPGVELKADLLKEVGSLNINLGMTFYH